MTISREQARAYVERWKAVRDIEIAELRALTTAQRYRHLVQLFELARHLPEHPAICARREREIREVRARWAKLKETLG
jgi:hypothetical protein